MFEAVAAEFVAERDQRPRLPKPNAQPLGDLHLRRAAGRLCLRRRQTDQLRPVRQNGTREKPTGGVFGVHFGPRCINVNGMWNEGAMGYQFMALGSLVNEAETLWHHGIDMYRYRGGASSVCRFAAAVHVSRPDLPATHDSSRRSILLDWYTDCQQAYEYGICVIATRAICR